MSCGSWGKMDYEKRKQSKKTRVKIEPQQEKLQIAFLLATKTTLMSAGSD